MKKFFTLLAILFCLSISAQNWTWAKSGDGIGTGVGEGNSSAIDTAGNVYITGCFTSHTITFGSYTLTNGGSAGSVNVYIAKYDSAGNVLWAKSAGGTGNDQAYAVCTDRLGNVFIAGYFNSPSITFGSFTLNRSSSLAYSSAFIVKYDANGNVLWAKSAGAQPKDVVAYSVSADATGNTFITGYFESPTVAFGSYTLTNAGAGANIFIAKYDVNGNVLWAKSAAGTNNDYGHAVSADASGNAFVTGSFSSPTTTFDSYTLTCAGNADIFIAKYDANGNVLWVKSSGGAKDDIAYSISTDAEIVNDVSTGNFFVTGYFRSTAITFDTYTLVANPGSFNLFVTKYDANGNVLWTKGTGGTGKGAAGNGDIGYSVNADGMGNVFVTGYFQSPTVAFNYDTLTVPSTSPDPLFIVKYDANGNILCASALPSGGDDQNGVSADRFGNAYIAGDFEVNPFIVGPSTLHLTSTTPGGENVFVSKYHCSAGNNSIKQYASNYQVNIYPNPAQNNFTIDVSTNQKQTISVFDVNGKQILSQIINGTTNINTNNLSAGVYNLSITNTEGVTNKRLVIVK